MLIVVSGTHASGKSTLLADVADRHPQATILPDPFEFIDAADESPDAGVFFRQLAFSARRLETAPSTRLVLAERGPLDFLAYLDALDVLGRTARAPSLFADGVPLAIRAMSRVDLLVLLPLDPRMRIDIDPDEDLELRAAMNESLLELADDADLVGSAAVAELSGDRAARLDQLEALIGES